MQVHINLKNINNTEVKPTLTVPRDVYGKPYESIRLEIRPVVGAILTIEKEIPAVNAPVMTYASFNKKGSLNLPASCHCFSDFHSTLSELG